MLKSFALGTLAAVVLTVAPLTAAPAAAQTKDIVDTAVAAGSFKTLAAALEGRRPGRRRSRARDRSRCSRRPTRRSPSCPPARVETLLKPENKAKLTRILTYHVVAGKVMAADVAKLTSAKAVSGDTLTIAAARRRRDDRQGQGREGRHRRQQRRHPRDRHGHPAEGQLVGSMGATILLTGATGHIGGRLLRLLEEGGP